MLKKNCNFAMAINWKEGYLTFSLNNSREKKILSSFLLWDQKKYIVPRREKVYEGTNKKNLPFFYKIIGNRTCVATLNVPSFKIFSSKVNDSYLGWCGYKKHSSNQRDDRYFTEYLLNLICIQFSIQCDIHLCKLLNFATTTLELHDINGCLLSCGSLDSFVRVYLLSSCVAC